MPFVCRYKAGETRAISWQSDRRWFGNVSQLVLLVECSAVSAAFGDLRILTIRGIEWHSCAPPAELSNRLGASAVVTLPL